MTIKNKPVICETTHTAFLNISVASQVTGCDRDGISRVCNGKQFTVKDSKGDKLSFRYAIELINENGLDWFFDNISLGYDLDLQQAIGGVTVYESC